MGIEQLIKHLRWSPPLAALFLITACGGAPIVESSSSSLTQPSSSSLPVISSTSSSSLSISSAAPSSSSASSARSSSSSSPMIDSKLALIVAINAGGTAATSFEDVSYQADKYFDGGTAHSTTDPIAGITEDTLYQAQRYGTYNYSIPVTSGTYTILLHMAELYWEEAGKRSFNVSIENKIQLSNLDLYTQVGHDGAFSYIVKDIQVTDGKLDISLNSLIDKGTLSGFAIHSSNGKLDTSVPPVPVTNCKGYVGITYDDGPANTTAFVNALKKANLVPVTFFVNGSRIGNNTAAIQMMLTVGAVESHGYNHVNMKTYTTQQATDQLTKNNQAIQAAGAPKPTIFRPPYGANSTTLTQAASALGLKTITWDVDSADWNGASTDAIVAANGRLQNGQVILMHENQSKSLDAIPRIAENLKSRGMCPGKLDPNTGKAVAP